MLFYLFFVSLSSFSCSISSEEAKAIEENLLGDWDIEDGGTFFFAGDRFSLSVGCNTLFGSVEGISDRLVFASLASTRKGCPPEIAQREGELLNIFDNSILRYEIKDDQVHLYDGSEKRVLSLVRPVHAALVNTWKIISIRSNNGLTSSIYDQDTGLEFSAQGEVSIRTACNSGNGNYSLAGNSLRFHNIALTELACQTTYNERQEILVAALTEVSNFSIVRDILYLKKEEDVFVELQMLQP